MTARSIQSLTAIVNPRNRTNVLNEIDAYRELRNIKHKSLTLDFDGLEQSMFFLQELISWLPRSLEEKYYAVLTHFANSVDQESTPIFRADALEMAVKGFYEIPVPPRVGVQYSSKAFSA